MVKAYLKYECKKEVGVVSSGPVLFLPQLALAHSERRKKKKTSKANTLVISCALASVSVWNLRKANLVLSIKEEVTGYDNPIDRGDAVSIATSSQGELIAVGFFDASIQVWSMTDHKPVLRCTLQGHKRRVSVLKFNSTASLLISGSYDTTLIVWDIMSELGLFKLLGHRDAVTDFVLAEKRNLLISASKDSFIKVWDLETQHCIQTLVEHRNEVWSLALNSAETRLVSGSVDEFVRVWSLDPSEFENLRKSQEQPISNPEFIQNDRQCIMPMGKVLKNAKGRCVGIILSEKYLICQSLDTVTVFQVNKKQGTPSLEFLFWTNIKLGEKLKGMDLSIDQTTLVVSLANNTLSSFDLVRTELDQPRLLHNITLPGHRSLVRSLALSSDNAVLLSCSTESLKVWNLRTGAVLKTIATTGAALCCVFVAGNRHAVIGTKEGSLEIYDLAGATQLVHIPAHSGSIWSLDLSPDKTKLISASADSSVKFWDFSLQNQNTTPTLGLELNQTLTMTREALWVRYSQDGKFLAVALLDNTVKIFWADSLKFFLSLYGHKLPVMAFDFSHDSTLVVTGSGDKNVRIWGTDFGDCHKAIFAHDDAIVQVRFVAKTHYFFSCSKDKSIKYFDADTFQLIQTLTGHHEAVWCLAVSSTGLFFVSGSQDRSIRVWERTEEQLFLQEERGRYLEQTLEKQDLVREDSKPEKGESVIASRLTGDSLKMSEKLMEALDLAVQERQKLIERDQEEEVARRLVPPEELQQNRLLIPMPQLSPLLMGLSPAQHVLKVLKEVRSNDLEQILTSLPYSYITKLASFLQTIAIIPSDVEFLTRIAVTLSKTCGHNVGFSSDFHGQLTLKLHYNRDIIGFNLAALDFLKNQFEAQTNSEFFLESAVALKKQKQEKKLRKKKKPIF